MQPSTSQHKIFSPGTHAAVVRYQVRDMGRAVDFYTGNLGFKLTQSAGPVTIVSRGDLHLILSGPSASGSRPMPDGRQQETGGWNRVVLYVEDLEATVTTLTAAGARFRNRMEAGPGGKQILVEDPDGNPVELHEGPKN